jgi:hypothetical protein
MTGEVQELDYIEVTEDLANGLVSGAKGTAVAVFDTYCMVEVVDGLDGSTIGIFDVPLDAVRILSRYQPSPSV